MKCDICQSQQQFCFNLKNAFKDETDTKTKLILGRNYKQVCSGEMLNLCESCHTEARQYMLPNAPTKPILPSTPLKPVGFDDVQIEKDPCKKCQYARNALSNFRLNQYDKRQLRQAYVNCYACDKYQCSGQGKCGQYDAVKTQLLKYIAQKQ